MSLKKESQELNEKEGKDQYKKHDFITGENSFSCSQTAKTQTRAHKTAKISYLPANSVDLADLETLIPT